MRDILGDLNVVREFIAKRVSSKLLVVTGDETLDRYSEGRVVSEITSATNVYLPTSGLFGGWGIEIFNSAVSTADLTIKVGITTLKVIPPNSMCLCVSKVIAPIFTTDWAIQATGEFAMSDIIVGNGLYNDTTQIAVRLAGINGTGGGTLSPGRTLDFSSGSVESRLGTESGLEKYSHTTDGGLRLLRVYTKTHNATTDWSGPTGGYYTMTISAIQHNQGTQPRVECYVSSLGTYELIDPDDIVLNIAGDVTVSVPSDPDLRYVGKVVVQQAR